MGQWFNIFEAAPNASEMRVFVSHQREDADIATGVAQRLVSNRVAAYVDVFDPLIGKTGDELGDYIRGVMGTCTHLMAVVSERTRGSLWVPWEIGIATEKEFPLSTFAGGECDLPEYLKKWPYLKRREQIDKWVEASRQANRNVPSRRYLTEEASVTRARTKEFYKEVRRALGQ
jgi:hypothetical protein